MLKFLRNDKGMTLVELLGAFVILLIIAGLSIPILLNGLKSAQTIQMETQFRNEADFLMASLIKDLYTTKESDILKSNMKESDKSNSYIVNRATKKETGMYNKQLYISGIAIVPSNKNIKILPTSTFELIETGAYEITLALEMVSPKKKVITYSNVLTTIKDEVEEK